MAELFDIKSQAITRHLKNIYNDEELFKEATCSKMEQVQMEGCRKICDIHKVWHGHLNKKDWSTYEQQNY